MKIGIPRKINRSARRLARKDCAGDLKLRFFVRNCLNVLHSLRAKLPALQFYLTNALRKRQTINNLLKAYILLQFNSGKTVKNFIFRHFFGLYFLTDKT